jgi:hypothetical protein
MDSNPHGVLIRPASGYRHYGRVVRGSGIEPLWIGLLDRRSRQRPCLGLSRRGQIRPIVKPSGPIDFTTRRIIDTARPASKTIGRIGDAFRRIVVRTGRIGIPIRPIAKASGRIVIRIRRIVTTIGRIAEATRRIGFTIRRTVETIRPMANTIRRTGITIGRIRITIRRIADPTMTIEGHAERGGARTGENESARRTPPGASGGICTRAAWLGRPADRYSLSLASVTLWTRPESHRHALLAGQHCVPHARARGGSSRIQTRLRRLGGSVALCAPIRGAS